ncbi:exonuclease [Obba rivulosa]|uniref:Exonuclease n=1 Tax=Obba rivulosa TaxID=1052685 RepID=A0A8E2J6K6_9APHY|nr:exonuclease [Obba rivulosa]
MQVATSGNPLRYLLILDFEATCGDNLKGPNEIIEFPTLLYDLEKDEVRATFHEYVRPAITPTLTAFCTKLTGITQDTVDAAQPFPDVWSRFQEFLRSHGIYDAAESAAFLTCGDWDLKTMLPRQLALSESEHGLDASGNLVPPYTRWINIKDAFRKQYGMRNQNDMLGMLRKLQLQLEGRHHSGIDDCKNILRIVRKMRADGWTPQVVSK